MFSPVNRAEFIKQSRSALAFECADDFTQNYRGWITQQEVDVVALAVDFGYFTMVVCGNLAHGRLHKVLLLRSECMATKLSTQNDVHGQVVNTVTCTVKIKIPDTFTHRLNSLLQSSLPSIDRMLRERDKRSSKHYPEIPCVIAKSLITKYQNNKKCRQVRNPVLPICGDKSKQIKLTPDGIRIPTISGKDSIPVLWPRSVEGHIRSIEFFRRHGVWYGSVCYNTLPEPTIESTGFIGVDRNSVGNIAVFADLQTGVIRKLGICPARTKVVYRNRRKNLQKAGKKGFLKKIRGKQSRRMSYENHRATKAVVDYAATHRRTVVIEQLEGVRKGKIRAYTEKNQWAFFQFATFLRYKCALRGIPLIEVNPAYTSQFCSRCGSIHRPNGKQYLCLTCGHNDHRDANAAFNIALRGSKPTDGSSDGLSVSSLGLIGNPQSEKECALCH